MAIDSFKATAYQVGRILRALTSDNDGNLILRDLANPAGVTLTELLERGGGSGIGMTIDITETAWTSSSYVYNSGPTFLGFEYTWQHNLGLSTPHSFSYTIFDINKNMQIQAQQVMPVNVNSTKFIVGTPFDARITITGI